MTPDDREAVRRAGVIDGRRSRAGQGLPERVEDPAGVAELAAMLRDGPRACDRAFHLDRVTSRFKTEISPEKAQILALLLSEDPGRCRKCGYLLTASGHRVTCRKEGADK